VEGFKLKDSGGGGQSHNAQAIPSGWGLRVANQSSDKYPLAVSQAEKQKTNNLKGGHGHGRSSCTPPGKPTCWSSSLKCLYTNTHSMGNKQEELEICVQSQSHDLIAITETWWDRLSYSPVIQRGTELADYTYASRNMNNIQNTQQEFSVAQ